MAEMARSQGKEDNQLSLDLAAMTGRESASGPDIQEAEPVPPRTLKEIYAEYQPVVLSRVLNDEAYQNALKNSDPENIRIEGDAAVKRAVLAVNEPELLRLYYDFPEFHTWPRLIRWAIPFIWKILCFKSPA